MASLLEYQTISAPPSVSSEQWKKYAVSKMSSGYLLIISGSRNIARFYNGNGTLENCSFRIAKKLLQLGYLEEVGSHVTGTMYQLSVHHTAQVGLAQITKSQMGTVQVIDDDDLEDDDNDASGYEFEETLLDEVSLSDNEDDGDDLNSTNI